ncbi:hypothetical protein D5F52_04835 [Brevibacillus laterosporus]|nr:hypothetical protein D5F52_04835 [Brevibacillus laterosporus]MBM7111578.1 Ribonucleoside-diphosphate reductase subunit beta [Brevibacillus laterosporus]
METWSCYAAQALRSCVKITESIHGIYIGLLSQELFKKLSQETQEELKQFSYDLLNKLYLNELLYTEELYNQVGLAHDVKKFLRYNANKALMNLGFDPYFEEEEINPIVLNGLNTKTKSHDFFSMKGNGYVKAKVEPICDEDFYFN